MRRYLECSNNLPLQESVFNDVDAQAREDVDNEANEQECSGAGGE